MTALSVRERVTSAVAALALCAAVASRGEAATLDIPTPYIPSTPLNVDEMLRLADVRASDLVYDLGSGDGRVVIAAARDWGARGVGIEIDGKLVAESRELARRAGVSERASFREGDVFAANISEATVVTMYLLSGLVNRLQSKLLAELKPGTRIVSHAFDMGDWKPEKTETVDGRTIYYWTIPKK